MTSAKVTEAPEEGYERGLGSRQVQMIAIGGAIGVGLFMGAGANIAKAGPSIILMYALAGVVIFFIMRALGELLLYRPVSGSFAEYAREFLGPFFGFVTGWTYWLMWVVTGMAELTAAAIYIHFWFPEIPQWVSALVFLVVLFGVNLISVKIFGEVEFWFSMIKVTAIIGMIVIGLGVLTLGFSDAGDTAAVSNLWSHDGFFPNGIGSSLMTLQGVMFAYLAVELVGVTAGESENPEKTLPKAINTLPWRIIVFYVGALLVILSVVRWTEFSAGESPFVHAFGKIGIPLAAGIVNFVVLTAALSSCNSGMYSTGRMLRGLAANNEAPQAFARLNARKTPAVGIAVSVALMGIGVILNYVVPEKAFAYVTSVATAAGIWTWMMILVSHIRYRRAVEAGRLRASSFPAPGGALFSWVALIFLIGVTGMIAADADARVCLYVAAGWAVALGVGWTVLKKGNPAIADRDESRFEKVG
ncbi:amino acid permease [Streptomyces albogriseolus]|uniref:Amino acid permease n=2 Tax=Streptomyces albogriseolus group TaxID=2867120 RepID=A0ABP6TGQ2_9ACTN|nr:MULTISPECIES: amino acid permease [Streptomyces]GHC05924.1 alanine glycine permease [Streptomyces albogriseolus]MCX4567159.1 amino acid permease [Streptomyces viridodiastaticus]MCX4620404.1 amino acid permease [Streptomyces viridodiastaticus]NIL50725.1 amino acid permease [Streptomyces sp. 2BBP-J2]GHG41609.1 alanine glycine permease [Streptomyces viridodiastaticus]